MNTQGSADTKRAAVTVLLRSGHPLTFRAISPEAAEEVQRRWANILRGSAKWLEVVQGTVATDAIAAIYVADISQEVKLEQWLDKEHKPA